MNFETRVQRIVKRMLQPFRQLRGMIRRATIGPAGTGPIPGITLGQTHQVLTTSGDVDDDVEIFEQYGFTSAPVANSECIVLRVGGERASSVAILVGNRIFRFQALETGEVAVYGGTNQSSIVLRNTGDIELIPNGAAKVRLGGDAATAILEVARRTDPVQIPSIQTLQSAINGWVPVAGDGGAALKTALAAWLALTPVDEGTIIAGGTGATAL